MFPSIYIDVMDGESFDLCACGVDWGIRSPAAAVLVLRLKSGVYYAVNEVYDTDMDAISFADRVRTMLEYEGVSSCPVWIDASTFNRVDGLVCVADRFSGVGLDVRPATRNRGRSLELLVDLFCRGVLVISPACCQLLRELKMFRIGSDRNDHAVDALRYAVYAMEVSSCVV